MDLVTVSEVFGPTVQGEGPFAGRPCSFIRLGACNLSCSWCDTPYTWDTDRFDLRKELSQVPFGDLVAAVVNRDAPIVVLSGGEPLLQQRKAGFIRLLAGLGDAGKSVHVETNGTLDPLVTTRDWVDHFSVSPKLNNTGDPQEMRLNWEALETFAGMDKAIFKFVAQHPGDLDEAAVIVDKLGLPGDRVWIMPEGLDPITHLENLQRLIDSIIARGWNVTARLHLLAWGAGVRGV